MKFLFLHVSEFSYEHDHPTPVAEGDCQGEGKFQNCAVVFVCVEKTDSITSVRPAAKEIRKLARKVQAETIVVNPFSHLSIELAAPDVALELLRKVTVVLRQSWEGSVHYTSFGWYKRFTLSVCGHEGSQVFRSIP